MARPGRRRCRWPAPSRAAHVVADREPASRVSCASHPRTEYDRTSMSTSSPSLRSSLSHRSWWSTMSRGSAFSTLSVGSVSSFASLASIGAAGSVASIGSAGSILSIGSAGSILSLGSAGSLLSVGSAGSILSYNSSESILRWNGRRMGAGRVLSPAPQPASWAAANRENSAGSGRVAPRSQAPSMTTALSHRQSSTGRW
jgi:hypothetical protein